jgi:hypothetical protein
MMAALPWKNQADFLRAAQRGKLVQAGKDATNLNAVLRGKKPATDLLITADHPLGHAYEEGRLAKRIAAAGCHLIDDRMGRVIVGRTFDEAAALHQRLNSPGPQWDLGFAFGYKPDDVAHFLYRMGWDFDSLSLLAARNQAQGV